MAAQETILMIVAIRESIQLIGDLATMLQGAAGITDEQLAQAKAEAKAAHNTLQETR